MPAAYDPRAPSEVISLSINSDLLNKAVSLDINLSRALERAIVEAVDQHQRQYWLEANRDTLDAAIGLFGNQARAVQWLTTPVQALGLKRPIDSNVSDVLDLIGRIENGFSA